MIRFSLSAVIVAAALGGVVGSTAARAQDAEAGKRVFARCMPCHNADTPQNKVGPSLQGLFGRTAGTVPGFQYSPANKNSGIVWSVEILNEYLKNPRAYMPGTKMVFPGIPKDDERANLIAFLEQATKK
jgi:cytochrome c